MRINRTLLHWTRVVHIYLTMAGLALMLFFAITGITVNHEEWFGATTPRIRNVTGQTPAKLLEARGKEPPEKLAIVEHLRAQFPVSGAVSDFEVDEDRLTVVFKGPGRVCEAKITRPTGETTVEIKSFGLAGRINDLHRARDTGEPWRIIVDISAALILLACVTGFILWLVLPKRRNYGIAFFVLGILVAVGFYVFVP